MGRCATTSGYDDTCFSAKFQHMAGITTHAGERTCGSSGRSSDAVHPGEYRGFEASARKATTATRPS